MTAPVAGGGAGEAAAGAVGGRVIAFVPCAFWGRAAYDHDRCPSIQRRHRCCVGETPPCDLSWAACHGATRTSSPAVDLSVIIRVTTTRAAPAVLTPPQFTPVAAPTMACVKGRGGWHAV